MRRSIIQCMTPESSPPRIMPPVGSPSTTLAFTRYDLSEALETVSRNRRHFPPDADIWHIRFHATERLAVVLSTVNAGLWVLSPLTLVRRQDGSRVAIWSAEDAVVITALTRIIAPQLPVSACCEHLAGHGGGPRSVNRARVAMAESGFRFVCRTDIKGYYAHIRHDTLYDQLCCHVAHPVLRNLLWQFIHYAVEDGGTFHSPRRGIPRASALSPLLAAFHLTATDVHFAQQSHLRYARFMDDFLIFTRTRHHLRRAVRQLNQQLATLGFIKHPGKTFIGRIRKGTDWMGFWLDDSGINAPAPRAISNLIQTLRRLYEQTRHLTAIQRQGRVAQYLTRWCRWARLPAPVPETYPTHRTVLC